jgi:hypothetical protein
VHEDEGAMQQLAPCPRRSAGPEGERCCRRVHGSHGVFRSGVGDIGDQEAGSGVEHRQTSAAAGGGPLTVDVHIGRLRKLLNPAQEEDPIRTVRGAGYALDDRFQKAG